MTEIQGHLRHTKLLTDEERGGPLDPLVQMVILMLDRAADPEPPAWLREQAETSKEIAALLELRQKMARATTTRDAADDVDQTR